MTTTVVEVDHNARAELDVVASWLRAHNERRLVGVTTQIDKPLRLLAHDNRELVGGIEAETRGEWLIIQFLAVAEPARGRGIGTQLLAAAETAAVNRGARLACVETMTFQAPEFYRRNHYVEVGRVEDWGVSGESRLILRK